MSLVVGSIETPLDERCRDSFDEDWAADARAHTDIDVGAASVRSAAVADHVLDGEREASPRTRETFDA